MLGACVRVSVKQVVEMLKKKEAERENPIHTGIVLLTVSSSHSGGCVK